MVVEHWEDVVLYDLGGNFWGDHVVSYVGELMEGILWAVGGGNLSFPWTVSRTLMMILNLGWSKCREFVSLNESIAEVIIRIILNGCDV